MDYLGTIEIKRRELEELKHKLDLVNICNPSRAEKAKQKLYKKLLEKKIKELYVLQNGVKQSTLSAIEW